MTEAAPLVRVERRAGAAVVTLDSPHNRNALSRALLEQLHAALVHLGQDPDVRVVVLTGAGPAFCSGADLKEQRAGGGPPVVGLPDILTLIMQGPLPLVARVNGAARAGGLGLIAACDLSVGLTGATFGFSEVRRSGTTGDPKGVVYSHRSTYLHSLAAATGNVFGLSEQDSVLPVVPMFHANAWGLAYAAWLAGADLVMPGRFLQAEPLARLIETERPTVAGAVPTIWNDLPTHARANGSDLSSLRMVACGGSAVPRSLMEAFQEDFGVRIVQAWGMTETSPLAAIALPPRGTPPEREMDWRAKTGRVTTGVELRIVDDAGQVLPWDGSAVGEIQVRGPWITGSYYGVEDPERFSGGWLRTGDVASVDELGFVQITDRTKDVIKSGGEWISSVELENTLMGHPGVHEAAVVAVPDPRWQERPLACVVRAPGADVSAAELTEYLSDKVAGWWLPEHWTFLDEVPKTSVGKFDKKVLRAQHADGALAVEELKPVRS